MALCAGFRRIAAGWRDMALPVALPAIVSVAQAHFGFSTVIHATALLFALSLTMVRAARPIGARRSRRAELLAAMMLFHYLAAIALGVMAVLALLAPLGRASGASAIVALLPFVGALSLLASTLPSALGTAAGLVTAPRRGQGGKYALLIYAALTPVFSRQCSAGSSRD